MYPSNKLRIICLVSVVMAFTAMVGSAYTFATRLADLPETAEVNRTESNNGSGTGQELDFSDSNNNAEYSTEFRQAHKKFVRLWRHSNPAIMGSCIAVFIAASNQTLISIVILVSLVHYSLHKLQQRIKTWLLIHFLAFVTLIICLFIPLTMDEEKEAERSVMELFQKIKYHLDPVELSGLLGTHLHAYYIPIGLNTGFLFAALISSFCFLPQIFDTRDDTNGLHK